DRRGGESSKPEKSTQNERRRGRWVIPLGGLTVGGTISSRFSVFVLHPFALIPYFSSMRNLNLVLLGLPSSGKSALLGALQEAAAIKGTELDGTLVDLTGGELAKLRKKSLDDKYHPTADAVAA